MSAPGLPELDGKEFAETRDTLHAYARVLGNLLKAHRPKRKHWWHASLRPSLAGLTTGVIRASTDFEFELNLRESLLHGRTASGGRLREDLRGQSAAELASAVNGFLAKCGIERRPAPQGSDGAGDTSYVPAQAGALGQALNWVTGELEAFRAGIREETSPIQLWPHHFDLSMLWLPGGTVPGQDPADEENSDPQMNFGFTFGDETIREPYFYATAYPLPPALQTIDWPTGTRWYSEGFDGAVLPYRVLRAQTDPRAYLAYLWAALLSAGREHMPSALL